MIVFFSASARALNKDIHTYRKITTTIRLAGHSLHNDWVETQWIRTNTPIEQGGSRIWDIEAIVQEVDISIQNADVVIAEATDRSTFGVGYEVAFALQHKKPVLVLIKKGSAPMSYATGVKNDLLVVKGYDENDIHGLITSFLEENSISTKDLRFNFVIDNKIYNHLRWKSFKTKKTKAEVVRELLMKDISDTSA